VLGHVCTTAFMVATVAMAFSLSHGLLLKDVATPPPSPPLPRHYHHRLSRLINTTSLRHVITATAIDKHHQLRRLYVRAHALADTNDSLYPVSCVFYVLSACARRLDKNLLSTAVTHGHTVALLNITASQLSLSIRSGTAHDLLLLGVSCPVPASGHVSRSLPPPNALRVSRWTSHEPKSQRCCSIILSPHTPTAPPNFSPHSHPLTVITTFAVTAATVRPHHRSAAVPVACVSATSFTTVTASTRCPRSCHLHTSNSITGRIVSACFTTSCCATTTVPSLSPSLPLPLSLNHRHLRHCLHRFRHRQN
jgi:hypothetical protein